MANFNLPEPQPDPLIQLIGKYRADTRDNKIDLGVGVYRSDKGDTPVLGAVKEAEQILQSKQESKSYLGLTGDVEFVDCIAELLFDKTDSHVAGAQTPGGSGALRLAAELFKTANPEGTLWVGLPTWPNHLPLTESAGVNTKTYQHFEQSSQQILFENILTAVDSATAGDAMIIHGCCHNPTGADLSPSQWQTLAEALLAKEILPIVDLAYHGLGNNLEQDLYATRLIAATCKDTIIATSCSKNFGLYRDRTGAVFMASHDKSVVDRAQGMFGQIARKMYSMPPDHGAAVVKIILQDDKLRQSWLTELDSMVNRINSLRKSMAEKYSPLSFVAEQRGMFSLLPLNPQQTKSLIEDHAVYLAGNGRINVAGCQEPQIERFVTALQEVGFTGVA